MKNEAIESIGLAKESQWQWQCRLVNSVADAYRQIKQLPVLCATDYDPTPATRPRRLSPDSIDFLVDVENGVRDACNGDSELLASWARLLEDDSVIGQSDAKAVRRLARVFEARHLHPGQYFKIIRRGSPKRRRA